MPCSPVLEGGFSDDGESTKKGEERVESVAGGVNGQVVAVNVAEKPAFKYTDLDPDSKQIRLLCLLPKRAESDGIEYELSLVNLDDKPLYKTLSYSWRIIREDVSAKYTISLHGHPFEIKYNLWKALERLRPQSQEEEWRIWIDAICINQADDTERNHQVAMMKMIYEQADKVIVWLGPEESTTAFPDNHQGLVFAQEIYDRQDSKEWIMQRLLKPDTGAMLVSLGGIFKRGYWQRIWVVQELLVAKRLVIHCGHRSIDGQHLRAVQDLFTQDSTLKAKVREALDYKEIHLDPIFKGGMVAFDRMKQYLRSKNPSLYMCLLHNHGRLSSDPRDMIYGLAALVNDTKHNRIKVNYNLSTREVFIKFARQEIETSRRVDIITRVFPGLGTQKLPTWAPDWTGLANCDHVFQYDTSQEEFKKCSAGNSEAIVSFDEESINVRGVRIGTVEISAEDNMVSLTFLESCIGALRKFWMMVIGMGEVSSQEHEAFARTLVFDKISNLDLGTYTKAEFLKGILGWLGVLFAGSLISRKDPTLLEYWKTFLSLGTNNMSDHERSDMDGFKKSIMLSWMRVIFQNIWDRQFFITSTKLMGLAAKEVAEGDVVCIPLGCCHPIVLRKVKDHYINFGEAYIDGFMTGEAMDMLERGELKLEDFEIH